MNQAHLHLVIVHIPIVLVPTALVLHLIATRWNSHPIKLVALNTFIFASICAIFAFLLGEGAEEIVEKIAGIAESRIESHEESAELALWFTIALGIASLANLISFKFKFSKAAFLTIIISVLGVLSTITLTYTAQQGGKIRHPEAFESTSTVTLISNDNLLALHSAPINNP